MKGVYPSKKYGTALVSVLAPIMRNGELIGVVFSRIKADFLYSILEVGAGTGKMGESYIMASIRNHSHH